VLVLRPEGQQSGMLDELQQHGAEAVHLPVIEICPPRDWALLDSALQRLQEYEWLLFTSSNAVRVVAERALAIGTPLGSAIGQRPRVCAIGPATAEAATQAGVHVDRMPDEFVAEGVVEMFGEENLAGKRLLLPRAAIAREIIPVSLRAQGMQVDIISVYRNRVPPATVQRIPALLSDGWLPDWVLFTSGSTVKNLLAAGGKPLLAQARLASIGPATSEVMQKHGLPVHLESAEHCADGLLRALVDTISSGSSSGQATTD
jgi:uroporphyrinogen III methyltransferase / synthase